MKQLLLLTLFIPTLLWAQEDSKYLAGAVPVENGKVVFAKEINAPSFSYMTKCWTGRTVSSVKTATALSIPTRQKATSPQ